MNLLSKMEKLKQVEELIKGLLKLLSFLRLRLTNNPSRTKATWFVTNMN